MKKSKKVSLVKAKIDAMIFSEYNDLVIDVRKDDIDLMISMENYFYYFIS